MECDWVVWWSVGRSGCMEEMGEKKLVVYRVKVLESLCG